jgi:hypothetical protein
MNSRFAARAAARSWSRPARPALSWWLRWVSWVICCFSCAVSSGWPGRPRAMPARLASGTGIRQP